MKGMTKIFEYSWAFLLVLILLSSCGSSNRVMSVVYEDIYRIYRIEGDYRHEVFVRQETPDSAMIYFKVNTSDLLHKRASKDRDFRVLLDFDVVLLDGLGLVSDTFSHRFSKDYTALSNEVVYGKFPIALKDTMEYEVRIGVKDVHNSRAKDFIYFLSAHPSDRRYLSYHVNGLPSRFCACDPGDEVRVEAYNWSAGPVVVGEYSIVTDLAPPPFSISVADRPQFSLLSEQRGDYNGGVTLMCPESGALALERETQVGRLVVPVFRSGFPALTEHVALVGAIRYIATRHKN